MIPIDDGVGPVPVGVRRAREDELDGVGALTAQVYAEEGYAGEEYLAILRDARRRAAVAEVLVAVADQALLGTVTYTTGGGGPYADLARPGEAELRMLATVPAARGRGVGAALVAACLARARADRQDRLVLSTQPGMLGAHRLYRRLGFARRADRDWSPYPTMPLFAYILDCGFDVRPVRAEEHGALGALGVAAYRARQGALPDQYAEPLRDVASRAAVGTVLAAATPAGRLLGGVTVLTAPGRLVAVAQPGEAEVRMLAVDPAEQGQGVGLALTAAAERTARAAGSVRLVLTTPPDNAVARRLYERAGYQPAPSRDLAGTDVRLLSYTLELGPS